jgi:hypothetical protein
LEDGFAEFGDGCFDGVESAEVLGDEVPSGAEVAAVLGGQEAGDRGCVDGDE